MIAERCSLGTSGTTFVESRKTRRQVYRPLFVNLSGEFRIPRALRVLVVRNSVLEE